MEKASLPATIHRRLIIWNKDGTPVPATVPVLAKSQIEDLALAVISLPYEDPLGLEPEFEGMTIAEVMFIRRARKAARGDPHATDALIDRILGRPKQSAEVKTMRVSYEDYLKEQAAKLKDAKVIPMVPANGGGSSDVKMPAVYVEEDESKDIDLGDLV